MGELKRYKGSCHCGNVQFEVQADLGSVISCNCSICSRTGYLLTFVPPEQFEQLAGEDAQTDYQFNTNNVHHLFCTKCGVRCFGRGTAPGGKPMYAINVRTLEGVDLDALSLQKVDGRSR